MGGPEGRVLVTLKPVPPLSQSFISYSNLLERQDDTEDAPVEV